MSKSSYKGFYGIMKGIVTRTDDPEASKNNNRKRIQVCIPSYHGEVEESKKGSGDDLGIYPWAQICSNMFSGASSKDGESSGGKSFLSAIIDFLSGGGNSSDNSDSQVNLKSLDMIYPSVYDYVWLMFEGGDIRCPVYVGSLSPDINSQVNLNNEAGISTASYTNNGDSLSKIAVSMIASINNKGYGTITSTSSGSEFGILGWKNSGAKKLFKDIRDFGPNKFTEILESNGAEKFENDINSSSSWSSYKVQEESNIYNALSDLLTSEQGKAVQDANADKEINEIISKAREFGIISQDAILLFTHTYFNGFKDAAEYGAKNGGGTLDGMYKCIMDRLSSYSSTTKEYRKKAYDYINNLINACTITVEQNVQKVTDLTTPTTKTVSLTSVVEEEKIVPTGGANTKQPVNYKQGNWGSNNAGKNRNTWYNKVFGPSGRPSTDTYSTSACSVTAMADIVYTWADTSVTPKTIGDLAISWGYRKASGDGIGGSDSIKSFYKRCASKYGFSLYNSYSGSSSYNHMYEALEKGNNNTLVIIGVKGMYSNKGHFVLAWKVDGDTIYINDPGCSSPGNKNDGTGRVRERAKAKDLKAAINSAYIFHRN